MKLAIATYLPEWHADWTALCAKLDTWVADAAGQGADFLVFPEYGGTEAALIGEPDGDPKPSIWRDRMMATADAWCHLHSDLAQKYGVHILAGSLCADGAVNRAYLLAPDGGVAWQDKLILTPYERNEMGLCAGAELRVFDTKLGRIGILICYDGEFPLLARSLVAAGADMILVPSATDLPAGYSRVSQSCRARAIEGQCLIVQSSVLGPVAGCDVVETGTGAAGVFCPPDVGLPSDGILALGTMNQAGWTFADVNPAAIAAPRQTGQVGNFTHWGEQDRHIGRPRPIRLG